MSVLTGRGVLKEARRVLSRPGSWCRGSFAVRKGFVPCRPNDEVAVQHCVLGAMHKALGTSDGEERGRTSFLSAKIALADALGIEPCALVSWNDDPKRTRQEVVDALDKAVEEYA